MILLLGRIDRDEYGVEAFFKGLCLIFFLLFYHNCFGGAIGLIPVQLNNNAHSHPS